MDELPELEEIYSVNPPPKANLKVVSTLDVTTSRSLAAESPSGSTGILSTVSGEDLTPRTPKTLYGTQDISSPTKRRRTNESEGPLFPSDDQATPGQIAAVLAYHERAQSFDSTSQVPDEDAIDSLLKAADLCDHGADQTVVLHHPAHQDTGQSYPIEVQPETPGVWPHASVQEACLMRYFIDELACWVGTSAMSMCHILSMC